MATNLDARIARWIRWKVQEKGSEGLPTTCHGRRWEKVKVQRKPENMRVAPGDRC